MDGRRSRVMVALLCLFAPACGANYTSERNALMDVPVDPLQGTSSIVIHRPLPVGARLHVTGVFKRYHRVTPKLTGFVVAQDVDHVQLAYDLTKTFVDVDLDGDPKRVRYDVTEVASNDAIVPQFDGLGERRSRLLHTPEMDRLALSHGQQFDIAWTGSKSELSMRTGKLTPVEREVLSDPFGPGYELWFEAQLARMFGPKAPKRMGEKWDIDTTRARALLDAIANLVDATKVTGEATFLGTERVGDLPVQRIEAWIKAEGKVRNTITYPLHANHNHVELKYVGLFPVDLSLPAVSHEWSLKGEGQLVAEVDDQIGDIEIETLAEHRTRVLEVVR